MTKITLSLLVFCMVNGLFAMEEDKNADIKLVQLPSQQEIARRLKKLELEDFVKKTKIDQTLGSKMENVYSTDLAVACAMYVYESTPSTTVLSVQLAQSKKTEVVNAILQDHPKSLDCFRDALNNSAKKRNLK